MKIRFRLVFRVLTSTFSVREDPLNGEPRARRTEHLYAQLSECSDGRETERIRARIIEVNMELAETLARRYHGHGERSEDLDQTAYVGLTRAVQRFEPDRGKDFLAYAVPTILGELRRHFRDSCWMIRPPRRIQELQARISSTMEKFAQDSGRAPDPWELSVDLDASVDDVIEALSADGCFTPSSLDKPLDESARNLSDVMGTPEREYERVEVHEVLTPLIQRLSQREHRIIELRFFWDWTQEQIAQDVGVTQMQVSRILSRTMKQLRAHLDDASATL